MKKTILLLVVFMFTVLIGLGQDKPDKKFTHGILFMAGGRYDNFRRCAATSQGTKGGPIADVMFVSKYKINETHSLAFNLPVFRPVLFGIAFKMLQFEPEFIYEYSKVISEKTNFITGPGLGVSFHYGPDYKSKLRDLKNSFFAMGPFFSWQAGFAFKKEGKVRSSAELKSFYLPLFARNRSTGTVLGGAFVYTIFFK